MTTNFAAGPHTQALWQRVQPIVARTEALPFLNQMANGSLDPVAFVNYIRQDSLYLIGYARAMALLAAKATTRPESRFWAESSASAISVEEGMHGDLLADTRLAAACQQLEVASKPAQASPTTLGYVSFLLAAAATESYGIGVAGVLPCFWVYAHVGKVLVQQAGTLAADHPYATWIAAYDSDVFDQSTRQAVGILEQALGDATDAERSRMMDVFEQACVYEWHFWATAHALQGWDLS
ncbi:TenA family protein [Castellaniella sp.]|uniref:TenA family protein n=1 Tax=Castellaniella sp. TaxID=1955812 RepID=UPI002AFE86DC|nr:TenA family protein [Castellaniella sp.]